MSFNFTDAKALVSAITTLVLALMGLLVAFGVHISTATQNGIVTFITVATPAVLALIAFLHHNTAKVRAAALNAAALGEHPPGETRRRALLILRE